MSNVHMLSDSSLVSVRKPPVAGRDQSWRNYKADIEMWKNMTELPDTHIVSTICVIGLSKNVTLREQTLMEGLINFREHDIVEDLSGYER